MSNPPQPAPETGDFFEVQVQQLIGSIEERIRRRMNAVITEELTERKDEFVTQFRALFLSVGTERSQPPSNAIAPGRNGTTLESALDAQRTQDRSIPQDLGQVSDGTAAIDEHDALLSRESRSSIGVDQDSIPSQPAHGPALSDARLLETDSPGLPVPSLPTFANRENSGSFGTRLLSSSPFRASSRSASRKRKIGTLNKSDGSDGPKSKDPTQSSERPRHLRRRASTPAARFSTPPSGRVASQPLSQIENEAPTLLTSATESLEEKIIQRDNQEGTAVRATSAGLSTPGPPANAPRGPRSFVSPQNLPVGPRNARGSTSSSTNFNQNSEHRRGGRKRRHRPHHTRRHDQCSAQSLQEPQPSRTAAQDISYDHYRPSRDRHPLARQRNSYGTPEPRYSLSQERHLLPRQRGSDRPPKREHSPSPHQRSSARPSDSHGSMARADTENMAYGRGSDHNDAYDMDRYTVANARRLSRARPIAGIATDLAGSPGTVGGQEGRVSNRRRPHVMDPARSSTSHQTDTTPPVRTAARPSANDSTVRSVGATGQPIQRVRASASSGAGATRSPPQSQATQPAGGATSSNQSNTRVEPTLRDIWVWQPEPSIGHWSEKKD